MNKIAQSLIAATAAIFLLAGCSSPSAEPAAKDEPTPSSSGAPSLSAEPALTEADRTFLAAVRQQVQAVASFDDGKLIELGHEACQQFEAGAKGKFAIRVLDGEVPNEAGLYLDSMKIGTYAAKAYCTDYDA